jgi:hypothetical protein
LPVQIAAVTAAKLNPCEPNNDRKNEANPVNPTIGLVFIYLLNN